MTKFVIVQAAIKIFMFFAVLVIVHYFVMPSVLDEISTEIDKLFP